MIWLIIFYYLPVAFFVIGPMISRKIGPITFRRGTVARNHIFWLVLPPDEVTERQGQSPRGRRAQEVVDYFHRILPAALISLFVVSLLPDEFGTVMHVVIGWLALVVPAMWSEVFETHFELVGHDAECLVAEYEARADYRAEEIERMVLRDSTFRGWLRWEVKEGMRKRRWITRTLLFLLRLNVGPA